MLYEKFLRNKHAIKEIIRRIEALRIKRTVRLMEVCGTHTYTFFRFGLRNIVPPSVQLLSGPGCPVCITEDTFIDQAVALARDKRNIIATFGDLIRVKGTQSSLEDERARGGHIEIVYSPAQVLDIARAHPQKRAIFLAVGFETTAPLTALVIKEAREQKLKNVFALCSHRLIPPAMKELCKDRDIKVDGFICPGHVSVVIGTKPYRVIARRFHKGCVICGFEPLDMVVAMYMLLKQLKNDSPCVENEYSRVVQPEGNPVARKIVDQVFTVSDASWRGFGKIKKSGLVLRDSYKTFDAIRLLSKAACTEPKQKKECLCAEVVKGKITPFQCPQFAHACSPDNPLGPCMVSFEGSCRIWHAYGRPA
ncbi:MAG: hydrogenase formation protein HypD [Candidatus Omnitrophota bacterium]